MAEQQYDAKQVGALGRFHHNRGEYPYTQGCVFTPVGVVAVYYEPASGKHRAFANFDIVHNGRRITRIVRKPMTERGLVIVAHRFAKEIANG